MWFTIESLWCTPLVWDLKNRQQHISSILRWILTVPLMFKWNKPAGYGQKKRIYCKITRHEMQKTTGMLLNLRTHCLKVTKPYIYRHTLTIFIHNTLWLSGLYLKEKSMGFPCSYCCWWQQKQDENSQVIHISPYKLRGRLSAPELTTLGHLTLRCRYGYRQAWQMKRRVCSDKHY